MSTKDLLYLGGLGGAYALLKNDINNTRTEINEKIENLALGSYIIYQENGVIYAKNGKTGAIEFSGTDAATVIQQAINALSAVGGGKIFIKAGRYSLIKSINLNNTSNIWLVGEGNSTVIKVLGNFPAFVLNNAIRCGIVRMHIYGSNDSSNTTNHGIYITGTIHNCVENRIIDVFVEKCYDGIRIDCGDIIWLERVYCWDNKNAGLNLAGDATWKVNWINVVDSYFGNNVKFGILGSYVMGAKFMNVVVEGGNVTEYGIFMDYSFLNWFINLDVENCVYTGIVSQRSIDAGGQGNSFLSGWSAGNGANGIYLYRERRAIINAFNINHNKNNGILLSSSEQCSVEACKVFDNSLASAGAYHGILLDSSTGIIVRGNHVFDTRAINDKTQGYGIYEYSASDYNIIINNDVRGNKTGGIVRAGEHSKVMRNIGYDTENFKSTTSVPIGTGGAYGSAVAITSLSGVITYPRVKITWGGTFGTGETVTVKVEAVYSDGSTAFVEKSATATGSLWLTDDDILALITQGKDITKINIYAKTNLSSTSVTVTVDAYGKG